MSVVILYRGQRKSFKCGAAPMKATLEEALNYFKISSQLECSLTHKNKKVELSVPFRLTSIPNNALLELSCERKSNSGIKSETRLAISCDNGIGNLSGKFRSELNLLEVLSFFVQEGSLPAPLLDRSLVFSPPLEVIYLRQRFLGLEALEAVTLDSLGLGGSSARFQARIPTAALSIKSTTEIQNCGDKKELIEVNRSETDSLVAQQDDNIEEGSCVADVQCQSHSVTNSEPEEKPFQMEQDDCSQSFGNESQGMSKNCPASVTNDEHKEKPFQMKQDDCSQSFGNESQGMSKNCSACVTEDDVHSAVTKVLNSNFDVVSSKAISTSLKFLDNLIKHPDTNGNFENSSIEKYRTINLRNRVVQEQIISCKNGIDILLAIGFVYQHSDETLYENDKVPDRLCFGFPRVEQDWELSPHTLKGYSVKGSCSYGDDDAFLPVSKLLEVREVLVSALKQLNSHRPTSPSLSSHSAPVEPMPTLTLLRSILHRQTPPEICTSSNTAVMFDPYKPLIMQASSDKVVVKGDRNSDQESVSSTRAKLNQLNKRRRELEGDRCSVERLTTVHLRNSVNSLKESLEIVSAEETDGQVQARALKHVMKKLGSPDDDGPPLTTREVKELEKAQKTIVYTKTLIKINLPDLICLQGYFHPRDTIHDVVEWLHSECFIEAAKNNEFDLYTTPPRRSLLTHQNESGTLLELSLVPAAVIYLAWQDQADYSYHFYLRPPLLTELKLNSEGGGAQLVNFPSGQKLVPDSVRNETQLGEKVNAEGSKIPSSKDRKSFGKPKWFKL